MENTDSKSKAIDIQLKYIHSTLEEPEKPTNEFSIIDICCTNLKFQTEEHEKDTIFLVAAFEGNSQKQSKCQFLMFDRESN